MIPFQKIHTIPNLHESVVRSTSSFENWFVTGGYDGNITIHNLPLVLDCLSINLTDS